MRHPGLLMLVGLAACRVPDARSPSAPDPAQGEVWLEAAAEDWRASLVVDNGETGVWTVKPVQLFPQYATPEVVALDDRGRCLISVSYSGKWTTTATLEDGKWLGGLAHADVDPRLDGAELYVGGQKGNLYQIVAYRHGVLDQRLIAHLPGREIHTILAGELDASNAGPELLVFTRPGGLFRITPTGPDGRFETVHIEDLEGRVRDALVLPAQQGRAPEVATVSRAGRVQLLSMGAKGPTWSLVHEAPMGKGRLTLAPARPERDTVLYTTQDDGLVLRHERTAHGSWNTETVHVGPQGPRGLAAGRFHADPELESLALFGYSREVVLLTRRDGGWESETLFVDRDKGHWLSVAELDGRNETDEILLSGYGARVVLLARLPGD
ncbi:MAG: hypothetical protein V3T22_07690 [Planctomycetota bacterium]